MVPKDAPKNSASYMSASKNSTRILRPQSKNTYMVTIFNMSRCNISVKQNLKKFHLTDFTRACGPQSLQGAKSVK